MAKISARGAQKVAGVEFSRNGVQIKMTVCSDGRILRQDRIGGRLEGFKLWGKFPRGVQPTEAGLVRAMAKHGWERV